MPHTAREIITPLDRTQVPHCEYYVFAQDNSKGEEYEPLPHTIMVGCETLEEASRVEEEFNERACMRYVRVHDKLPVNLRSSERISYFRTYGQVMAKSKSKDISWAIARLVTAIADEPRRGRTYASVCRDLKVALKRHQSVQAGQ